MTKFRRRGVPVSVLLIAASAILFIPLVALGIWESLALAERERSLVVNQAGGIATEVRSNVNRTLTHYIAIMQTLATSTAIDTGNLQEFHNQATTVLLPLGLHALLRDLTGQQLINTRVPFGTDLPREKGFDDPLLESREPYVTDIHTGAVAKKLVVGVSVPVTRENELHFILTLSLDPEVFANMLAKADLPKSWSINLVDRQGVRIARSARHGEFVGVRMPDGWKSQDDGELTQALDAGGRAVVRAMRRSGISDWYVVVSAPIVAISSQVSASVFRFLVGSTALALSALLAAYFLGQHIVTAIGRLTKSAKDLGEHRPVVYQPTLLRETNVVGEALVAAARQREEHEEQIRLLMREIHHRSKNMLTVIQSMARRTEAEDIESFRERLSSRLGGLAASQDVLVNNRWQGADIRELVTSHLSLFGKVQSSRFQISGPALQLSTGAAQALGMALHELGTNASKYGSLAVPDGSVAVVWKITGQAGNQSFQMSWQEHGGPTVTPPSTNGFGHTIIVKLVESALDGTVDLQFSPDGVLWTIDAPLEGVQKAADD